MHEFIDFLREEGVIDVTKAESFHTIGRTRLLFGVIALRRGFIDFDQLQEVLEEKSAQGEDAKTGEILLQKGYMTTEQITHVLEEQKKEKTLPPELLLETGLMPRRIIEEELRKFYHS